MKILFCPHPPGINKGILPLSGEIKIPKGPGYRVYFAEDQPDSLLLLMGGDKKTQNRDMEKIKKYWKDYGQKT